MEPSLQQKVLVDLLQEFFSTLDNSRKLQIEQKLLEFKEQENTLLQAEKILSQTSDQYLLWFATSMVEHFIKNRWHTMDHSSKQRLLSFLVEFLCAKQARVPPFVSNSSAKVVVTLGKLGWPHEFPDFFEKLFGLARVSNSRGVCVLQTRRFIGKVQAEGTSAVGVYLLVLSVEEFTSTREDVSSSRRKELKELMIRMLPDILSFFGLLLELAADKPGPGRMKQAEWVMNALLHLFSWMPLDQSHTASLVQTLFKFFGAEGDLALLAFSCVNELLRRNFVPVEYKPFLVEVFQQVFSWLGVFVGEAGAIDRSPSELVGKFTEFTLLFVSSHLHRVEGDSRFPLADFFSLLLEFTFKQTQLEGFLSCLGIWTVLVEHVDMQGSSGTYQPIMVGLFSAFLDKLLFSRNADWLESLVDLPKLTPSSQYGRSEFFRMVDKCLVVVAHLVAMYPGDTVDPVHSLFIAVATQLASQVEEHNAGDPSLLADTLFAMRISTCLVNHFVRVLEDGAAPVLDQVLSFAEFAVSKEQLRGTGVHLEALITLRAWAPWLGNHSSDQWSGTSLGMRCVSLGVGALGASMAYHIQMEGARLLLSLTTTARLREILTSSVVPVAALAEAAQSVPSEEVQAVACAAVSNGIVVASKRARVSEADWSERANLHRQFFSPIVAPFLALANAEEPGTLISEQVTRGVSRTLLVFQETFKAVHSVGNSQAHSIVFHTAKEALQLSVHLFPHYINHMTTLVRLLDFFKVTLETMHAQLDEKFIQGIISGVIGVFKGVDMAELVRAGESRGPSGNTVLVKFLELLVLVAEDSSSSAQRFVPDVLQLCLKQLYPPLASAGDHAVEARSCFFNLLHSIGAHQWKILAVRPEDMSSLLGALVSALEQTDVNLVRQVLLALESINEKHLLYSRDFFIKDISMPMLNALTLTMVSKTHDLLRDELISTIYDVASVDFASFYSEFIPAFLRHQEAISPEKKEHLYTLLTPGGAPPPSDMPTFRRLLNDFVNDYSLYTAAPGHAL